MQSPYLTASEAAAYLRLEKADGSPNLHALYTLRWRRGLKAVRRGGRLLFRKDALERFLEDEESILDRAAGAARRRVQGLPCGKVSRFLTERVHE